MEKAQIYCRSRCNGKYLFRGNCFEEELYIGFKDCEKRGYNEKDDWYILLHKHLETNKGKQHEQDILDKVFLDNVTLEYEFAQKLNLFDIINAECLTSDNELGNAIIQLCIMSDMKFIVSAKYYTSKQSISIDFEVCHIDSEMDCHKALIKQTI